MVAVLTTRVIGQVAMAAPAVPSTTRMSVEVGAEGRAAGTAPVDVTRVTGQTAMEAPENATVTRLSVELGGEGRAASAFPVDVTRVTAQAAVTVPACAATTRMVLEVGAEAGLASAEPVDVTRITGQLASRSGASRVVPLALPTDFVDFFLHNWASRVEMETSYLTDVTASVDELAEERRGLVIRPTRTLKLRWTFGTRETLDRAYVQIRRLTAERFPAPLVQDYTMLTAPVANLDTTLSFDTTQGRFFLGQRIAIQEIDVNWCPVGAPLFYEIDTLQSGQVGLSGTAGVILTDITKYLVFPMIDCEIVLEPEISYPQDQVGTIELTVQEVEGPSALPGWAADTPDGFLEHDGDPIFSLLPDWSSGHVAGWNRAAVQYERGRARRIIPRGSRYRATQKFRVNGDRDDMIPYIKFMDSRRGRLRPYWLIDQETIWNVVGLDGKGGIFVEIDPLGDFEDFDPLQDGTDFGAIGIEMADGTMYVRDAVTFQDILAGWRVTVSPGLPTTLDVNQVVRVARARRHRNVSDSYTETWTVTNYMTTDFDAIEILDSGDYTT